MTSSTVTSSARGGARALCVCLACLGAYALSGCGGVAAHTADASLTPRATQAGLREHWAAQAGVEPVAPSLIRGQAPRLQAMQGRLSVSGWDLGRRISQPAPTASAPLGGADASPASSDALFIAPMSALGFERASPLLAGVAATASLACDGAQNLNACLGAVSLYAAFPAPADPMEAARAAVAACDPDHCPLGADAFADRLQQACDLGSAPMCAALADALDPGPLLPTDAARSRALRARACELGDSDACLLHGMILSQGTSPALADSAAAYARACDLGHDVACDSAARAYGVLGDLPRAVSLYARACGADRADAHTPDRTPACLRLADAYHREDPTQSARVLALYARIEADSASRCPQDPLACDDLVTLSQRLRADQPIPADPARAASLLLTACHQSLNACTDDRFCDAPRRCQPLTTFYADHFDAPLDAYKEAHTASTSTSTSPAAAAASPPGAPQTLALLATSPPPPLPADALPTLNRLCDSYRDPRACFALAHIAAVTPTDPPDHALILRRLTQACGELYPVACLLTSRIHRDGFGDLPPNPALNQQFNHTACTYGVHALCPPPPPEKAPKKKPKKKAKGKR
jgi:TPR repeat protein